MVEPKGEELPVQCSNCKAPLVTIWTTGELLENNITIIANCPHCEDDSFTTEVSEKFYIGGTDFTSIDSIEYPETDKVSETQIIKTSRIKQYG